MPSIKNIQTGEIFTVPANPQFKDGVWDCGDLRFQDPEGSLYEAKVDLPVLTPMTLYMAFTAAERIAIKNSADPMVKEFWEMYDMSVRLNKPTDPNLVSVQEALQYLATPASPGPGAGILASQDRVQQILQGIPQ